MNMRFPVWSYALGLAAALLTTLAAIPPTFAVDAARRVVHPIFVNVPDAPQNDLAQQRFDRAAKRFGLGPIEVVVIEPPKGPDGAEPAERLKTGIALVTKLEFGRGLATLDQVAADVAATGGSGLDSRALGDLYFYRGWALGRADFNPAHVPEATARAQGYAELVRAAMLNSHKSVNPKQFPPLLVEDWQRAVTEVRDRAQSTLLVQAAPEAFVTLDGGNPIRGPATFVGVVRGEHVVHVDEPTFAPWGATIVADRDMLEIAVPERRALTLPDAEAAARARRMGMEYGLVAEPRPGLGGLSVSLRLVDRSGARRDSAIAQIAGDDSALDAAVMRLDEQARRWSVIALQRTPGASPSPSTLPAPSPSSSPLPSEVPASDPTSAPVANAPSADGSRFPAPVLATPGDPPPPSIQSDPIGWARAHWPLVVAVGVMVAATVILSVGVASDR